jgi:hypothetical protein
MTILATAMQALIATVMKSTLVMTMRPCQNRNRKRHKNLIKYKISLPTLSISVPNDTTAQHLMSLSEKITLDLHTDLFSQLQYEKEAAAPVAVDKGALFEDDLLLSTIFIGEAGANVHQDAHKLLGELLVHPLPVGVDGPVVPGRLEGGDAEGDVVAGSAVEAEGVRRRARLLLLSLCR